MITKPPDFISRYMEFCDVENSEAPAIYHRWTCMSILGAYFGRNIWMEFGSGVLYPNQYIMLMGDPGTRKGTAMGIGKKLLKTAGYHRFAADKTSKERFLMDMKQYDLPPGGDADLLELTLDTPAETYICSGEFTDFIGQNNMEFVTMLTNLWDNLAEYVNPKITGKSVRVEKPTVNLLGANTPEGFSLAFPPEALGNGFLSRVILLYAEVTGNKIAWPEPPSPKVLHDLADIMTEAKDRVFGEMHVTPEARALGTRIYKEDIRIEDPRFSHYKQRRFIHLLKNAMLIAAIDYRKDVSVQDILRSNTMLAYAERKMPKALGEFGASRFSTVAGKILNYIGTGMLPKSPNEIWKAVRKDIHKISELTEILAGLKAAEEIQHITIKGKSGYLPKQREGREWPEALLDTQWLTDQEII